MLAAASKQKIAKIIITILVKIRVDNNRGVVNHLRLLASNTSRILQKESIAVRGMEIENISI